VYAGNYFGSFCGNQNVHLNPKGLCDYVSGLTETLDLEGAVVTCRPYVTQRSGARQE